MNFSNEELITDIKNTQKELAAYQQISEGYKSLGELPENKGKHHAIYALGFEQHASDCKFLLAKLIEIAQAKGIETPEPVNPNQDIAALRAALERAEQTVRNLGNGELTGDSKQIALNEARNIRQALERLS